MHNREPNGDRLSKSNQTSLGTEPIACDDDDAKLMLS